MDKMPENKLYKGETRVGVYDLLKAHDEAGERYEVTVYQDGSVLVDNCATYDDNRSIKLTAYQVRQLALIFNATQAGGPTMRGGAR